MTRRTSPSHPTAAALATALLVALLTPASAVAQADTKPAGGAAIQEIVLATAGAMAITLALVALGWAHRTGRVTFLKRLADFSSRQSGLPGWAALPTVISTVSLLGALFGMLWDISLHIDDGRDSGPLANPAHYFILAGLFGVFAAGFLATVLPEKGRPTPSAVRIAGDWYAPLGGLTMLACGGFALFGFPLDDVWHRLFGQDVTLWGPTHLMLIGGAGLSLIGQSMLVVEGARVSDVEVKSSLLAKLVQARLALAAGGLLVGLSVFQAEFDFGVPQFRMLFQPVCIAVAGAIALTAARVYAGAGAALAAAAFFLVVRGIMALLVGPVLGEAVPHFPLYLGEALVVEALALFMSTKRPYAFGAVAGALIGTVGFAIEYAWTQVFMPIPWPTSLIGEAAVAVVVSAIAAGMIGAYVGAALRAPRFPGEVRVPSLAPAAVALTAMVAVVGYGLQTSHAEGIRASLTLADASPPPARTVNATVRIEPASAAADPNWLNVTAWQGGRPMVLDALQRTGPGVYRTTMPIPVHGSWKSFLRLHDGASIVAVPIYLPEDRAIPAPGVAATPRIERAFVPDKQILQREQKSGLPTALPIAGYSVVAAIALGLVLLLGWALARLGASAEAGAPPADRPERTARGRAAAAGTA